MKSLLACRNLTPQVLFAILDIAKANFVPFFTTCWMCCLYRSPLSKMTPRYLASPAGCIVVPEIVIVAVVLRLLFLVKCTSMYFDGSNRAPCLVLQVSAFSSITFRSLAFSSSVPRCTP